MPTDLVAWLRGKGALSRAEIALCIAYWLTEGGAGGAGGAGAAARHADVVTAAGVRAAYPRREMADALSPWFDVYTALAAAVAARFVERAPEVGRACYRVTALGRAVAVALPDRRRVRVLRGAARAPRCRAAPLPMSGNLDGHIRPCSS